MRKSTIAIKTDCPITLVLAALVVVSTFADAARADPAWTLSLEGVSVEAGGHDPQTLTVSDPAGERGVGLEAEGQLSYRVELRWERERWTWGLGFFSYLTDEGAPTQVAAGSAGPVLFQVPGRSLSATRSGETLFYRTLEDTALEIWTADLFGLRTIASRDRSEWQLLVGIRSADFDNDYRAVAGLEGLEGRRFDASSNYDRMRGPRVGLVGRFELGRSTLRAQLDQSLVFGRVELTSLYRDFVGPFGEDLNVVGSGLEVRRESVGIPITDLRVTWTWDLSSRFGLGVGASASLWSDVPVAPGVEVGRPVAAALESDVLLTGLSAVITFGF